MFFTPTSVPPMERICSISHCILGRSFTGQACILRSHRPIYLFLSCLGHSHSKKIAVHSNWHANTPKHTKTFFLLSQVSQVFLRGPSTSVPLTVRIDWYLRIWGGWVSQQPPLQAHLAVNKYFFTNSGPLFITGTPSSQLGLFFSPLYLFFTGSLTQKLVLYEILTYPQILPHLHGKLIAPSLLVSWTEFEDR